MNAGTAGLYAITALIWGSTWIMIKFQLGVVPLQASLTYRFAIATVVLGLYAIIARRRLKIAARDLPMVAIQGMLMFSLNYYLVYWGAEYVPSGLIAVLFTVLVLLNSAHERLFFGTRLRPTAVFAGLLSIAGVALMFLPEVGTISLESDIVRGILLVLGSTYFASLGNMAALANSRRKLPVVAVNLYGMAIGTLASAAFALFSGVTFSFDPRFEYWGSLLYLAVLGTAVAFCTYLELIERIGVSKAAYITVLMPVIALLMSTVFENYEWTGIAGAGLALAIVGNAIALASKEARTSPKSG